MRTGRIVGVVLLSIWVFAFLTYILTVSTFPLVSAVNPLFWGAIMGLVLVVRYEPGATIGDDQKQERLAYFARALRLKASQEKDLDLYHSALVKYGSSMITDSLASKEMCNAANRLQQSAREILKRREVMASIPDMGSAMYSKWQRTYSDYSASATAQCAAIEALAKGMIPNT